MCDVMWNVSSNELFFKKVATKIISKPCFKKHASCKIHIIYAHNINNTDIS